MLSSLSKASGKHRSFRVLFLSTLVVLSLLVAACGAETGNTGGTGNTGTPANTPVADLELNTPGTLIVGSDTTYPPQEFADPNNPSEFIGFDLDVIKAVGEKLGLKVEIQKASFSTIIDDLVNNRYDIVISALTINPERSQVVNFVPYFQAGKSILVQKGNPENIKELKDLCGKEVGVQKGTVEFDDMDAANKDGVCKDNNIKMTILDDQTAVIQLLVDKRVVATYQDSPVTDYYNSQNAGIFEVGGPVVDTAPQGIAVSKSDTKLFAAVQKAFNDIKSDGTYDKLFEKWKLDAAQKVALSKFRQQYV